MSSGLETDLLLDRRRLKRRLFFWRGLAVAAVLLAVLTLVRGLLPMGEAHVARLNVFGIITDDRRLVEAIIGVGNDSNAKALIVSIDSPGGSVSGGTSLHAAIGRVAAKKPVVAVMGGTAASAGYMIAMPAAWVFARDATLTGSIGVLLQTGEVSGLLAKLGIGSETTVSGPLKDQPSLTYPTSEAGRAVLNGLVADWYEQFVEIVAAGRHMPAARVRELADGRPYTGRQALKLGLVDAIGFEPEARAWLQAERQVAADLPVHDVEQRGLVERTFGDALGSIFGGTAKSVFAQWLNIDAAQALWQPGLTAR
jgi:protease-4